MKVKFVHMVSMISFLMSGLRSSCSLRTLDLFLLEKAILYKRVCSVEFLHAICLFSIFSFLKMQILPVNVASQLKMFEIKRPKKIQVHAPQVFLHWARTTLLLQ